MTLLNTVCNLGGNWPSTLALWAVDLLTWKTCHSTDAALDGTKCNSSEDSLVNTIFSILQFFLSHWKISFKLIIKFCRCAWMAAVNVLWTWTVSTSNLSSVLCLASFGSAGADELSDNSKIRTKVHGKCPTKQKLLLGKKIIYKTP